MCYNTPIATPNLKEQIMEAIANKPTTYRLGTRQEDEVLAEHLARHAVRAAQVAAVGDRDAQVAQRTREGVG